MRPSDTRSTAILVACWVVVACWVGFGAQELRAQESAGQEGEAAPAELDQDGNHERRSGGGISGLDVPLVAPAVRRAPDDGATPAGGLLEQPTMNEPDRERIAVIVAVGSGMAVEALPRDADSPRQNRLQLALTELIPYLDYLSADTEVLLLQVGRDVVPFSPARTEPARTEPTVGDPPPQSPRSPPTDGSSAADTLAADTSARGGPTQPALPAVRLSPWGKQTLFAHLRALMPHADQEVGEATFLDALERTLQVPGLARVFLISDTVGGLAFTPGRTPVEPSAANTAAKALLDQLWILPAAQRPRIDVLSVAPAGSAADVELRFLARRSGGVYLHRP